MMTYTLSGNLEDYVSYR